LHLTFTHLRRFSSLENKENLVIHRLIYVACFTRWFRQGVIRGRRQGWINS